ncbi:MAG TPA: toll/interleukin-1 receptor domain-containing protein [Verrucomicrobiota bacterium]|nr:hypothetical protein [Verrucomicrobiales bacterium]HRI13677.1 toll/interleukin-1 receptor domain-containing protein [Verrucomicrobiota bacterium]
MPDEFPYDIFLSHSAKDKAVVRNVAERLRKDGVKVWPVSPKSRREGGFDEWVLKPGDSIPAKINLPSLKSYGKTGEGLDERSGLACPVEAHWRRRMLCMSANAFGSDWAQLAGHAVASLQRRKAGTFRFRDPLNKERRFLPLRLADCELPDTLWRCQAPSTTCLV